MHAYCSIPVCSIGDIKVEGEAKDGEVKKCSYSFKDVQNPIFQEIKGKGNIYIYIL